MVIPGDAAVYALNAGRVYIHVPRLTPPTPELCLHFWGMTSFVTLAVIITGNLLSILMTLSGMVGGVVPPVSFNSPPWFYKELPQPTTNYIEVCHGNFGPAKKLVRGTKIPWKNGPPGPFSP